MKVAYLSDQIFSTSESSMMLNERFGAKNVMPVTIEELAYTDLSGDDLLFLPGIPGEKSPYPKILTPQITARLMKEVERGMIIWTDCAATYEMLPRMKFHTSSGKIMRRKGSFGWIDGRADGPVEGSALPSSPDNRFQHVTLRQVFYMAGGEQRMAWAAYGNGPGITLSEEELRNPDVNVIGRYGPDDTSPIATMSKKIGKGMLLSLGVLVQIAPYHASAPPEGARHDETVLAHRATIHRALTEHDHLRLAYLDHLIELVKTHYKSLENDVSNGFSYATGNFASALLRNPA